jgi:hypothetical protein
MTLTTAKTKIAKTSRITPGHPRKPHRLPAKIRQAIRAAEVQNQCLPQQIVAEGNATAALAAAQASGVLKAELTPAELQSWMKDMVARLETIQQHPEQNLGEIEEQIARGAKEPLRLLAQRAAQIKANATSCCCPDCQRQLTSQKYLARTITSRFGLLVIYRGYGWCSGCKTWHFAADYALGLGRKAPASPYVQEICALLTSKMPPEQAGQVAERLGLDLSRCTLHREAHRQGLRALKLRAQSLRQLDTWEDLQKLAHHQNEGPPLAPFTLVIEIDAWNIRERDDWGKTQELRLQGQKLSRWHWVYMGTVFRLDCRGQTFGERPVITQRGFVATRHGLEALLPQLYREALARGLGQAERVLVIADGAVKIRVTS